MLNLIRLKKSFKRVPFDALEGLTITGVEIISNSGVENGAIIFKSEDREFLMTHIQEDIECFYLNEGYNDLLSLVGQRIVSARENGSSENYTDFMNSYVIETDLTTINMVWIGKSYPGTVYTVDLYEKKPDTPEMNYNNAMFVWVK